jgi:thioredoxin reductase (NADPH)
MYDLTIIGAGPAGLSAAITARARNKEVLVLSNKPQENPLAQSHRVDNYPGMPQTSGLQLLECMVSHAQQVGARFTFARVISVLPMGTHFSVSTSDDFVETRSVIIATGAQRAQAIAGEKEFLGHGVSYCATCDGMLYRRKTVVLVGLNSESVEEANFLAEIGATVVFLATSAPRGLNESILVQEGTPRAVQGTEAGVTGLLFTEKGTDAERVIPAKGVFILRDSIAPDVLISGLALAENARAIAVDTRMHTNIEGLFAAGDCTGAPLQIAKAAGEGQVAALSAVGYLS